MRLHVIAILCVGVFTASGCGDAPLVIDYEILNAQPDLAVNDLADPGESEDVIQDAAPELPLLDVGSGPADIIVDPGLPPVDEGGPEDVVLQPCPIEPCVKEAQSTPGGCVFVFMEQGVQCDDLDDTTRDDQCNGFGECFGIEYSCDDTTLCTPSFTQDGSGCVPEHAPSGTFCDDGDSETVQDNCDGEGGCAGAVPCFDLDPEPNDTTASGIPLGTISDCDGDGGVVTGVLNGVDDQDWYSVNANDGFTCSAGMVVTLAQGNGVELCTYTQCTGEPGGTEVDCEEGVESSLTENLSGCCSNSKVKVSTSCPGWSDDITAYIRVRKQGNASETCSPYSFEYHN